MSNHDRKAVRLLSPPLLRNLTNFSMMPRFALRKMSLIQSGVWPREEDGGAPPPPLASGLRCLAPRAPFPLVTGVFVGGFAALVAAGLISNADLLRGLTVRGRGAGDGDACWLLSLTFGGDGCTMFTTFGLRGCSEGGSGPNVIGGRGGGGGACRLWRTDADDAGRASPVGGGCGLFSG